MSTFIPATELEEEIEYVHRLDFHYVTLPLLAQWNFAKNKWRFFFNTGPYLGYLTSMENVFEGELTEQFNLGRFEKPFKNHNKLDYPCLSSLIGEMVCLVK